MNSLLQSRPRRREPVAIYLLGAGQAVQQMLYGAIVIGLSWMYTRIASLQ